MQKENFLTSLKSLGISFAEAVDMKLYTTFKIGGPADIMVNPKTKEEVVAALKSAKEFDVPVFILGNGSNILVSDSGIEGAVINLLALNEIRVEGEFIECEAGASLMRVCNAAKEASLKGLEFAYGIPGSIGGAFYMNAGAYGGEIKDVAYSALCIDKAGNFTEISKEDMQLSYRSSRFKADNLTIVSVKLRLQKGNKTEISNAMSDFFSRRKEKQPLEFPSAGSTFKRPQGYYAGALIEQNGFKGKSVGGAMVSEKHAGFVINYNNATQKDVTALIELIKKTVKQNSGVELEPEVIPVGRKD